jgi:hypothetical protein
MVVEDFEPYRSGFESHSELYENHYHVKRNIISMFYKLHKGVELMNDYTMRNGKHYDLVIEHNGSFIPDPDIKKFQLLDDINGITPESGVIRIQVDDYYTILYNGLYRAADVTIDFDELEVDTLEKLNPKKFIYLKQSILNDLGEHKNYNRSDLRNMFYSSFIYDNLGVDQYNNFNQIDNPVYNFPVSTIYNYNKFVEQLGQISTFAGKQGWNYCHDELYPIWNEFIQRNQGYQSYKKCQQIIEHILNASNIDIKCNIIEEAYINSFITRTFNLYDGIACFDENVYPTNTRDIHNLITNQVRKNRDL